MSAAPPGGNGQIIRTGFSGYGAAYAAAVHKADASNAMTCCRFFKVQGISISSNLPFQCI
ncbi:MAG: hypothetical protein ACO22Q_13730 [Burkholderiales bacterium]